MRKSRQVLTILFGLLLTASAVMLRWDDPPLLQQLRELAFDEAQRISPRPHDDVPVRIIDIDEASLAKFGQWPWPRTLHAEMLGRLLDMGAAVVAYDVLFAEPDRMSPRALMEQFGKANLVALKDLRDNDEVLAGRISGQPVVLGYSARRKGGAFPEPKWSIAFTGESPIGAPPAVGGATLPLPILKSAAAGLGDITMNIASSSPIVRTLPLFLSDGKALYPSLAMEALRVAQGANTYIVANAPEVPGSIGAVKIGSFEVPTTAAGELRLYMTPESPDRYISAGDVLSDNAEALRQRIEGHIIFIGTSAPGLLDIRATPLGELVPGVSIHAQAVEQILTQRFLHRPDWADGAEVVMVGIVGVLVVVLTALFSSSIAVSFGAAASLTIFVGSFYAFRSHGLLIDSTYPVLTALLTQFMVIGFRFFNTDRERRQVRRALSQYVSPGVLARVENQFDSLKLGGEERKVSLLFMDVRNFTTISEKLTPTELVSFLNTLLSGLSQPVIAGEGTLDKFIGDSIMAFWNAPIDVAQHEQKAARCALSMREALRDLNTRDAFGLGFPIGIGVGINSGIACVGNMGSQSRFNYSAVGDAVNVAARIESSCKEVGFDLLVSDSTASGLGGFALLDAGELSLKGKSNAQRLHLLVGDDIFGQSEAFKEIAVLHHQLRKAIDAGRQDTASSLASELEDKARAILPELAFFYARIGSMVGRAKENAD